ncbi:MAG: hypothetical protein IJV74_01340 [Clostridia bacterium]|nr:hypothetical protein [Clostridia bacterium]
MAVGRKFSYHPPLGRVISGQGSLLTRKVSELVLFADKRDFRSRVFSLTREI